MSPRAAYPQRESEIIKIMSFKGSRESPQGAIILLIASPVKAWWSVPYILLKGVVLIGPPIIPFKGSACLI